MRGAITAAAASPTANGGASDKTGPTCATCGHSRSSISSSSSSSDGRKWRGRRKVGLPVTLATALAVVLLLVLGVLDLEGGFVGDHLRSSVLEQVAAAAFPAGVGAGGTEEESRSDAAAAAEAAAAGVGPEGELVDWPRCLAKTQHLVYRKAALRFPTPPRLRRLFADYEAMHRRCTVGKDWDREARAILGRPELEGGHGGGGDRDQDQRGGRRRLMADTQAQSSSGSADAVSDANRTQQQQQTDSDDKCQYLFLQVDPGSGLGNRLLGIVSGFLYALITNRALLTDPNEDVWHLLCDPFYNSSWFLPHTFPVEMVTNVSREMKDAADQELSTAAVVTVRLKHVVEPSVHRFWCSHTQEQLQAVKWILWRSNQHLVPRFFATPHFWPRLHTMFLAGPPDENDAAAAAAASPAVDPSKMFLHLSRHLILPRNSLWERILRIYWAEMADAKTVVGVQIRRHGSVKKLFSMEVHQRMMECLVSQRLLPNTTTTSASDKQSDDDNGDRPDSNSSAATVQRLTAQMRRVLPAAGRPALATPAPRAANDTPGSNDWDSESSSRWEVVRPTLLLPATTPPPSRRPFLRWPYDTQQPQQATDTTVLMETSPQNVAADTAAAAGPARPIVVLIASLRADYWDEMKAQYTAHPTVDGSLVRVLQVTHDTNQRQSLAQMGDALVEMWLLSFADHLVISSWSTFGYVPIGLSGIAGAYIMNVRGEQLRPEPACTRWRTSDPCNHFPFFDKAACPSSDAMMSPEQQDWVGQRIGPCETRTGIQLLQT